MAKGLNTRLWLPYKEELVQNAIRKHAHRFDPKAGIRNHANSYIKEDQTREDHRVQQSKQSRRSAAESRHDDAQPSLQELGLNVSRLDVEPAAPPAVQLRKHIKTHVSRRGARLLFPPGGHDDDLPSSSASSHSSCLPRMTGADLSLHGTMDLQLPTFPGAPVRIRISEVSETWLKDLQEVDDFGTQSPLRIGTAPDVRAGVTIATPRPPTVPRATTAPRKPSIYEGGTGEVDHTWAFLRHVPYGEAWISPGIGKQKAVGLSAIDDVILQGLFSEVTALLEEPPRSGSATPLALVQHAPQVTVARWTRILKPTKHTPEGLAKRLARVLVVQSSMFTVTSEGEAHLGPTSSIKLVEAPVNADGENDMSGEAFIFRALGPNKERAKQALRWSGILAMAKAMAVSHRMLEIHWVMSLDAERFRTVMASMERDASVDMCRDAENQLLNADGKVNLRCCQPNEQQKRSLRVFPKRGGGLTADWLIQALGEHLDEDRLEAGDSVRLLAAIACEAARQETFTAEAWLLIVTDFLEPMLLLEGEGLADKRSLQKHPSFAEARACITHYMKEELANVDGGPLILEALLQRVAEIMKYRGGSEELVMNLLWEICGWDSPAGRRMVRRLCKAFERYAKRAGELLAPGFLRLCHDAGLHKRTIGDSKSSTTRLNIFTECLGSNDRGAHFLEFMHMIETIFSQVLVPQSMSSYGDAPWEALEGAINRLSGGTGFGSPRAGAGRLAVTAKARTDLRHSFNRFNEHAEGRANTVPNAMPNSASELFKFKKNLDPGNLYEQQVSQPEHSAAGERILEEASEPSVGFSDSDIDNIVA